MNLTKGKIMKICQKCYRDKDKEAKRGIPAHSDKCTECGCEKGWCGTKNKEDI